MTLRTHAATLRTKLADLTYDELEILLDNNVLIPGQGWLVTWMLDDGTTATAPVVAWDCHGPRVLDGDTGAPVAAYSYSGDGDVYAVWHPDHLNIRDLPVPETVMASLRSRWRQRQNGVEALLPPGGRA